MLASSRTAPEHLIRRQSGEQPIVLVTDAERASALAIMRSLKRQGCRVIAAGDHPRCAGFRSRAVDQSFVYPNPRRSPEACGRALFKAARDHGVHLLIPVTDDIILPLNALRHEIPDRCVVAMADDAALCDAWDKQRTWEIASEVGVPCPVSKFVTTVDEAFEAAKITGWPAVVKPVSSRALAGQEVKQFRVQYAHNADQMRQIVESLAGVGALIQEMVVGVGRGVEVLAQQGQLVAAFQHRRLREVPLTGGVGSLRESETLDPTLLDYAARLVAKLNWTGLAMVEFKQGAAGPRLMEINGRVWGSLPLAVCSGMDFPAKLLQLHLGQEPSGIDTHYRAGVRCRNLWLDLRWAGAVLSGQPAGGARFAPVARWKAAAVPLGLLSVRNHWDSWSIRDPMPGLASFGSCAARLARMMADGIWRIGGSRKSKETS